MCSSDLDNTGRYVKSTRPDAVVRKDYYGFSIYVLVGMLPYTFCLIGSFFRKTFIKRVKDLQPYQMLCAAFLPCLILFSFSGHTKLARYIAYVFPPIMMLLAHNLAVYDLKDPGFRKICKRMVWGTIAVLTLLLGIQIIQFTKEVQEGMLFTISAALFLYSLILITHFIVANHYKKWIKNATQYLWV